LEVTEFLGHVKLPAILTGPNFTGLACHCAVLVPQKLSTGMFLLMIEFAAFQHSLVYCSEIICRVYCFRINLLCCAGKHKSYHFLHLIAAVLTACKVRENDHKVSLSVI